MPNINIRIPAIEKLVDYVVSGVGVPMLSNWRAHKEGKASLTAARYDAEVRLVEAKSQSESLIIIAEAQAKAKQTIELSPNAGRGIAKLTRDDIVQSIEFQGRKASSPMSHP